MGRKRIKITIRLNPPDSFREHERQVKQAFTDADLAPEGDVEVIYGHGPVGEVSFSIDELDHETDKRLVALAEQLRTGEPRAEFLSAAVWLTAEGRDAAEGPNPQALDQPISREGTPAA